MAYKAFFYFLTAIISLASSGQGIQLENLTVSLKESKIIYIGIDNRFKVNGFENLRSVEPDSSIYTMRNDTIILKPNQTGTFTLTFHTKGGIQQINFETKVISDVMPAIGNLTNQVVNKSDVVAQRKIQLHTFNTKEVYFKNYNVSSFEAHLDNQVFTIQGDRFTNELLAAIRQAKSGDHLIVTNVKATNDDIGKSITLKSKFSFQLK